MENPDFGIALGLAYQSFTDDLRAALAKKGFIDLGRWYGYVFRALDAEEISLSGLAVRLQMTNQGAAKIVDEMVERGYVERRADATDGRVKRLRLAPRGLEALAAARRFHGDYERRLARRLGAEALRTLRGVLAAISGAALTAETPRLRPM